MFKAESRESAGILTNRLLSTASVLTATAILALTGKAGAESLAEECQSAHPLPTPALIDNDFLERPLYGYDPIVYDLAEEQAEIYKASPERNALIAKQVGKYAAGMVERANSGDGGYELWPRGDDFGGLNKHFIEDDVRIVGREYTKYVHRAKDGTYDLSSPAITLDVHSGKSQAVFTPPEHLGLLECSSEQGNGASQGWRVAYYDFWPADEMAPPNAIQGETFYVDSVAAVQEIDKRALQKIGN